jgi:hypothetical protein
MRFVKAHSCPGCHATHDAVSGFNNPHAMPRAGDFSICLYCAIVTIYCADGTMRVAADDEIPDPVRLLAATHPTAHGTSKLKH